MPATDQCEPQVIAALQKAGWKVIKKQQPLRIGPQQMAYLDLLIQQTAENDLIIVEVKCFPHSRSPIDELYRAIGQYQLYRAALTARGVSIDIYLSIPERIYSNLFQLPVVVQTLQQAGVKYVVIDLKAERITRWVH